MSSLLQSNGLVFLALVESSAWSSPFKAVYKSIISPKIFVHRRWGKSLLVCQREECDPNNMYTVAVKADSTKTVQSKRNNDLLSSQLHFITFILTNLKLAHGPVKFSARLISHFVMNISMAKTGSTAKVNFAK